MGRFSTAWLGLWAASLTPVQFLMPDQLTRLFTSSSWQEHTLEFGIVSGVAAAVSVIVYPVVGMLSDRTGSRYGRRRPWIVAGTLVAALSLLMLAVQTTFVGVVIFWALATVGFCTVFSGLTSLIADQVPVRQRGLASGLIAGPQAIGAILGVLLVTNLFVGMRGGYIGLALLLIALVTPMVIFLRDPVLTSALRPQLTTRGRLTAFWTNPVRYPDFGWALLSRALANLANTLCTGLLLYFLMFGLHRRAAGDDILTLTVIYAFTAVLSSLTCGRISDRLERRRVFVVLAAILQVMGALPLAVFPSFELAILGAFLLGLGWGCYQAVDQALVTQVLPDAHNRGKDLGIMNIAAVVPTGAGPLLGALIVTAFGNFNSLYVAAIVAVTLSAAAVVPIRSVK